jgi:hypothetical protein
MSFLSFKFTDDSGIGLGLGNACGDWNVMAATATIKNSSREIKV